MGVHGDRVSIIFTVLSILVGILITAAGIYSFVSGFWRSIIGFVLGIYYIIFGVMIVFLEISFPARILSLFGFYAYWFGKGLFFILLGLLILSDSGFFLFAGIVVIAVGLILCIIHFISTVSHPKPLTNREAAHPSQQA
ncbi:putative membrane protein [Heterostelium album PN500]|uniref:Putative membrane protein n=1 Tax=Heterostelium pallidum (strain ATCC 26659 / Pp 5 / PN500) TaxID=670386 RepID=D3AXM5_HETP5|nr:putative membrane protein [Heterostelium album PN500]EFA85702.1 putative membrane protein [Heterostelium album PN500]|eukprot:XP_020437808.1 putative membrane protein [Heterostelium album PN500]